MTVWRNCYHFQSKTKESLEGVMPVVHYRSASLISSACNLHGTQQIWVCVPPSLIYIIGTAGSTSGVEAAGT